jgi:hypothetical protein
MTITITRVGTADVNSGGGGTNSTDTFTSVSQAWTTGDYVIVGGYIEHNSVDNWTFSTTLSSSGGAVGTATRVQNVDNLLAYNPGYEGRAVILVAQITTGFTGTVTVTRTPSGSADHWTSCDFYRLQATGAITFPRNDDIWSDATSDTITTDLGATPDSTSALFAVIGSDIGTGSGSSEPTVFPSGWTRNDNIEGTGWSGNGEGAIMSSGFKVGSGTQTNAFTLDDPIVSGGSIFAVIIEIAEASGSGTTVTTVAATASIPALGFSTATTTTTVAAVASIPTPSVSGVTDPPPSSTTYLVRNIDEVVWFPNLWGALWVPGTGVSNFVDYYGAAVVAASTVTGTSVTPAVVAAVAAVLGLNVQASATVTVSPVAVVVAVNAPSIATGTSAGVGVVSGITLVGGVTMTASATFTPTVVAAVASIPSPTITASGTRTTTTVQAVASIPAVTVGAAGGTTVTTVAAVAAVNAVTITASGLATVTTVAAVATVPAVSVSTGSNQTVPVTTVAATAAVNGPVVSASGTVVVSPVAALAAVNAVTLVIGTAAGVGVVQAGASIPGTGTTASGTMAPVVVAAIVAIPGVTIITNVSGPTYPVPGYRKRRRSPRVRRPSVVGGNLP